MAKFLDPDDPFFRKTWVRWACVLFPLTWGGFELWLGNPFWGVLFLAVGGYAGWMLLIKPSGK